jgi:hypothetical protein
MDTAGEQMTSETLQKGIAEHYRSVLGEPSREAQFVPRDGPPIQIWKWSKSVCRQGVNLYATIGASLALTKGSRRVEFLIGLDPDADDIAGSLAEVALHGVGTGGAPAFGDTTTLAAPLWKGTAMQSFLFTTGGDEKIPSLVAHPRVEFVQLVPLFPEEVAFKKKHGEPALWEVFKSIRAPYWDPWRRCELGASS